MKNEGEGAEDPKKSQQKKKKVDQEVQRFIDRIWEHYDDDGSGGLDQEETKGFLLDYWPQLGNGREFDEPYFAKKFKDFDDDGSGAIEKDEMAEFLDVFLNPPAPEEEPAQALGGNGPKLTRQQLVIGKPSKEYQRAVVERDKQMKGMKTSEQVQFLQEWHENMRKQLDLEDEMFADESEDPEELKQRDQMLARYRMQIEKPYLSDNIFMELSIINLKHFYDRARKEQRDINKYFLITKENEKRVLTPVTRGKKKPEGRIQFEERCFLTKLSHLEVVQYLDMMKKRVADIEQVIDAHFDIVKIVILKEKQDKLWRAMKRDQEEARGGGNKTSRTTRAKSGPRSARADKKQKALGEEVEDGII